jgi:hypothetical protein
MAGDLTGTASNAQIAAGAVSGTEVASTFDISGKTVTLPAASVTAHVTSYDDSDLQNDIALLGFKIAANGSLAKYNLADQTIDAFEDASGISAGGSTNDTRDSSGKYYWGVILPTVTQDADDSGVDGDYTWYKWTDTASTGSYQSDAVDTVEWLVLAGGAGGGEGYYGGGGGAGGYRTGTHADITANTTFTITVGAGGTGSTTQGADGTNGGNSILASDGSETTVTSTGGGGGASRDSDPGAAGGSGGGAARSTGSGGAATSITPVTGETTTVQGYAGGGGSSRYGNSGGGAGQIGQIGATNHGATGGDGVQNDIIETGTDVYYGGGGGGGSADILYAGGQGGGGSGGSASPSNAAAAGTDGLGGGGGGGGNAGDNGAHGGNGIVILRRLQSTGGTFTNMTLVSTTTTAQAAPTKGDIVFTYTNGAGTTTIGGASPDVTAEYSADGGSTWTSMTLASEGSTGGHNIATAHDVTLTSTSGTSMAYRIKTLNQSATKTIRIHAVSLGWS